MRGREKVIVCVRHPSPLEIIEEDRGLQFFFYMGTKTIHMHCLKKKHQCHAPSKCTLFVIVGEALSCMIEAAAHVNLIKGFKPSTTTPTVTHLQFADDAPLL